MNNLYTQLAEVYEAMYQTFIPYDAEFAFYFEWLDRYGCRNVLEIGCGSGNLAGKFSAAGFSYMGLDLSADMLDIARRKHPEMEFIAADMRDFTLPQQVSSAIMTGRTISYLPELQDVIACFQSVRRNLQPSGIFCFDFIDARRFMPRIWKGLDITHQAEYEGRQFHRDSHWQPNAANGWCFDWHSTYFEKKQGRLLPLGADDSTIRTFTRDEISLALELSGFEIMECLDRPTYAFETYVMVARALPL